MKSVALMLAFLCGCASSVRVGFSRHPSQSVFSQSHSESKRRFLAGDRLLIRITHRDSRAETFRQSVDLRGNITLPRYGEYHAAGKTAGDGVNALWSLYGKWWPPNKSKSRS